MGKALEFFKKNNVVVNFLIKNTILAFLILLVLHFSNVFDINFILRFRYVMIIVFSLLTFLLFLFFEKEKGKKKKTYESNLRTCFFFSMVLLSIGSIFEGFLESFGQYFVGFTMFCGIFTFYFNYENIRSIAFGRNWYYGILFLIFLVFLITRLYNNEFINASDNYNLLGVKNLYENGVSFYSYSPITDNIMLFFLNIFGWSLFTIKIPFLIYSFITLVFINLIGKKIDMGVALLAPFLFAISPWAIAQSRITRDYSFDLMIAAIVIYLGFLFYEKIREEKKISNSIKYFLLFSLIPLSIFLLSIITRGQVLTTGIYALFIAIFILFIFLEKFKVKARNLYWAFMPILLIVFLFLLEKWPFRFGFSKPDNTFLKMFFDPTVDSPWQWYHGINIEMLSAFFIVIFALGFLSLKQKILSQNFLLTLGGSFVFIILLYSLKFESHLNYIPTRYIYFAFIPFVLIFSNGILNLLRIFPKYQQILLVVLLFSFITPNALAYSIHPYLQYEKKPNIYNIQADNIGIGRFDVLEFSQYLQEEENLQHEDILVIDGGYELFTIYLDRPMDSSRKLVRDGRNYYDIAKNTYVQSDYFGYYEVVKAVNKHRSGFYISNKNCFQINEYADRVPLGEHDFFIGTQRLNFEGKAHGFKIYSWEN